jgi:hypothetical protein
MMPMRAMKLALACGLACLAAAPAGARKPKLPPYPVALRCAVLTGAYMHQVPEGSKEGLARFDKALFWGLATAEAAAKAKLPRGQVDRDVDTRLPAVRAELEAGNRTTRAELEGCLKQVPPLPGRAGKR